MIWKEKEIENINKGGCQASKHVELWARNVFDEWWVFHGFSIEKLIIDLFENEDFVMNLVEMFFFLQVVRKDGIICPLIRLFIYFYVEFVSFPS